MGHKRGPDMKYLFAASVGPVQGFIAAARKTRDLFAGSWIVSEIAKAASKHLENEQAELIFPFGTDLTAGSEATVSNKILAVVETESAPLLAAQVKKAALARILGMCGDLDHDPIPLFHKEPILREHLEGIFEFYASWAPFPDGCDYAALYEEVEAGLNARKMTRTFARHNGAIGLPKSSLDGMRESILPRADGRRRKDNDTRVREDEELDGAGYLKRFVKLPRVKFDSVREVAARPYKPREPGRGDELYYAILMADGDNMGKAISRMPKEEQQRFSVRLSKFASAVRERLDGDKLDCMTVFAGGDELTAMVPLHRLREAAETVRTIFRQTVCANGEPFTISAGIAIVHEMEPLDDARALAETAKKRAKRIEGEDAICIIETPRSGADTLVAGEWDWMMPTLDTVVIAYLEKRLSYGFGHELWDVVHRTPRELEDVVPDLSLAVARHKTAGKVAARQLVEGNRSRSLADLAELLLVARKVARAREIHDQAGEAR